MSIAISVVILVLIIIAAILIVAARKQADFSVRRAIRINAPQADIFPLIADFRRWSAWSPYEKKDLAMTKTYSGASSGKGAVYEWAGNSNVGHGRMEIAEVATPSKITILLHFIKPFEARNIAEFALDDAGGATNLSWTMRGNMPFFGQLMSLFLNMDKMVGKDFEAGLAQLKAIAEK